MPSYSADPGAMGAGGAGGAPPDEQYPEAADQGTEGAPPTEEQRLEYAANAIQAAEADPTATGYPEEALAQLGEATPEQAQEHAVNAPIPAVPQVGPTVQALAAPPPPVARPRPRPPTAPPGMRGESGGRYYAPGFLDKLNASRSEIENLRLKDKISDAEANQRLRRIDAAEAAYGKYKQSLPGAAARLAREQGAQREVAAQGEMTRQAIEAGTSAKAAEVTQQLIDQEQVGREHAQRRMDIFAKSNAELQQRIHNADRDIAKTHIGDRRTGGQRAWDAVAAALGFMGAALTKTPDTVSQSIQDRINRDVDAQKEALASKRQQAGKLRNDLDAYKKHFGNVEQAQAALRARYLDDAAMKLDKLGQLAKTDKARAAMVETAQAIRQQRKVVEAGLQLNAAQQKAQDDAMRARINAMQQAAKAKQRAEQAKIEQRQRDMQAGVSRGWIKQDQADRYIEGLGFVAAPPQAVNKIRDKMKAGRAVIGIANSMMAIRHRVGRFAKLTKDEASKEMNMMSYLLASTMQKSLGEGVVRKEDTDLINDNAGQTDFFFRTDKPLKDVVRFTAGQVKAAKDLYHVTPGKMVPMADEKGNVRPYAVMGPGVKQQAQQPEQPAPPEE